MEEKFYFVTLFEIYKDLLTAKQREIFLMHFSLDLSLSEIAEEQGISRQNVSDTVKKTKDKLKEFEKILKISEKESELIKLSESLKDEKIKTAIKEIIGK